MQPHSTNYYNTFITTAPDSRATCGVKPPEGKEGLTAAGIQYALIQRHPYKYTSDDILFMVYASKHQMPTREWPEARATFFAKGQPCMRTSPLTKRYGWGIHCNTEGKLALVGCESKQYKEMLQDPILTILPAMRSSRN